MYNIIQSEKRLIKAWTNGVPVDDFSKQQLIDISNLPFVHKWIAAMPDVHGGNGSAVGTVIPTLGAIIPATVGVDIGCGMSAVKTSLTSHQLPDNLKLVRIAIESAVPHGRSDNGGENDTGAWGKHVDHQIVPAEVMREWDTCLAKDFGVIVQKHPKLYNANHVRHLGTLGTGNHFIEICVDENDSVWVMLHSGSRGIGNRIGQHFIKKAKKDMERWFINLPNKDLSYLVEGSENFNDYVEAVEWAQRFASINREIMMRNTLRAIESTFKCRFNASLKAVDCHHNYIAKERHYGKNLWITRKGAVRARIDDMGIIPGSMGERSFIVRGLGNRESFCSCSHGAGRVMSRTEAKRVISADEHKTALKNVECRDDESTLDETPKAYKDIDAVMKAQEDLVEIVHTLKQVVCVKG